MRLRQLPALLLITGALHPAHGAAQTMQRDRLLPRPSEVTPALGQLALPLPRDQEQSAGYFTLPIALQAPEDGGRLERATDRLVAQIADATGIALQWRLAPPDEAWLTVTAERAGELPPRLGEDESYRLSIVPGGARLEAATTTGLLRGYATFAQWLSLDRGGFHWPAVTIEDWPRFAWRGLLVDPGRHWLPVDVILRQLEGMAAVKLNVLHWHLTEDQGFRIESKTLPRLHESGSDGLFYTQEEIREVLAFAHDRGIRVLPEFDVPGHATSWLVGYPEIASGPGPYRIIREFGIQKPTLDPSREETWKLLETFVAEMADLFPDAYLHIGGDEVTGEEWEESERIRSFMANNELADMHELQLHFNRRLLEILQENGKLMGGWEEIQQPGLPTESLVQSWRGAESLIAAAQANHPTILSRGWYLDHMLSAETHYAVDPHNGTESLTAQQRNRILGGEACMWGEFVDPETIDSRIWPRLGAIAERLWSSADTTDVDWLYDRLGALSQQLDRLGLLHEANLQRQLRRLSGGGSTEALRVLVELVEPVKYYQRPASREYRQATPFNRLVDAARPESLVARDLHRQAIAWLEAGTPPGSEAETLKATFVRWRSASERLEPVAGSSELLDDVQPLVDRLGSLAEVSLLALEQLLDPQAGGTAVQRLSSEQTRSLLQLSKEPAAEVLFVPADTVEALVSAATDSAATNGP